MGAKERALSKSIVPFLPLTFENIYAIIQMELKYMGSNIQEMLKI